MMKDWAEEAADEIIDKVPIDVGDYRNSVRAWIAGAIQRYCPMKPDVAYMPVPRCETCAFMDPRIALPLCRLLNVPVTKDFGCVQWKEK